MRIKIKWGRGIETFVHRRYQKFEDIFNQLAAKESADRACIFLNLDDRIVYASDTPDSIDYKPHQFIGKAGVRMYKRMYITIIIFFFLLISPHVSWAHSKNQSANPSDRSRVVDRPQ